MYQVENKRENTHFPGTLHWRNRIQSSRKMYIYTGTPPVLPASVPSNPLI